MAFSSFCHKISTRRSPKTTKTPVHITRWYSPLDTIFTILYTFSSLLKGAITVKPIDADPVQMLKEKLKTVPIIKKVVTLADNQYNLIVYAPDRFFIQLVILDRAFPGKIAQVLQVNGPTDPSRYSVIAAPYISPASAEACERNGAGYIDYCGNCLISLKNIYISDTGHKNLFPKEDKAKNIFRSSARTTSRILRELLKDVSKAWKLSELSGQIGCSIGMVSRVKDHLCDQAWAKMDRDGLRITDAEGLLHSWADAYNIEKDRVVSAYTLSSLPDFEKKSSDILRGNGYGGCLTAFSGGVRYAPVVRYNRAHLWILRRNLHDFMKKAELKTVESGANVIIYVADEDEVLVDRREVDGAIVASPVQTYLDCMQQKGRGEEIAEAILVREILK